MMHLRELAVLEDISVRYGAVTALENVNLSIYPREFLAIIGPNGGGKTTLLKVLLGLAQPYKGKVSVLGKNPKFVRKQIGYVPQHTRIDPQFPVDIRDVVLMGRYGHSSFLKKYTDEDIASVENALKTVEMLDHIERQIGTLSMGQQQRVFLARALVSEPMLLLLDEPTASVDEPMRMNFYELLGVLKQEKGIVLVTHDITAVSVHVDKVACLNRRLFYHDSKELAPEDIEAAYECPVDMIAHGVPHRVLRKHEKEK